MKALFADSIKRIEGGGDFSVSEAQALFDRIFAGEAEPDAIASLLLALRNKGESVDEIHGAAAALRARMAALAAPENAVDIMGTGGDGRGTLNVSTAAALIASAAGAVVAKHCNRAGGSLSGSADVLAALRVNPDPPFSVLERSLAEMGLVFLFAPRHHRALCFVAPVRRKLGVRTIVDLLLPLANPAQTRRHLIGVFNRAWSVPMAQSLSALGSARAWVVHGADGMDELSTTGLTHVTALQDGAIKTFDLSPNEAGVALSSPKELQGGDAQANASALRRLLEGEKGAYRDVAVLNAAAALVLAGKAESLKGGVTQAVRALDTGAAKDKLARLIALTNAG